MPSGVYIRTIEHNAMISKALCGNRNRFGKEKSLHERSAISKSLTGRTFSKLHCKNISLSHLGEKNWQYVKNCDPIKHKGLIHRRIRNLYGKAKICENKDCTSKTNYFEWSNKRHTYTSFDRNDWQQLCISCHKKYDMLVNGVKYYKDNKNV